MLFYHVLYNVRVGFLFHDVGVVFTCMHFSRLFFKFNLHKEPVKITSPNSKYDVLILYYFVQCRDWYSLPRCSRFYTY